MENGIKAIIEQQQLQNDSAHFVRFLKFLHIKFRATFENLELQLEWMGDDILFCFY